MLSHLRFHRRAPSNPTSPLPDQGNLWDADHPPSLQDVSAHLDNRPRSSNSSQLPPTLPPIARVASTESEPAFDLRDDERPAPAVEEFRPPPPRPAYNGRNSGFIGGVALRNYEREIQGAQRQDPALANATQLPDSQLTRAKPPPPPINTGIGYRPAPAPAQGPSKVSKSSSFIAPTDLHQYSGPTGKRPAGTRLTSEPASLSASAAPPETHRAKKGLPFLKNPMSTLLMRRKAVQSAADFAPAAPETEPAYDPRIRGTRVHDFSAPRPKRVTSTYDFALGAAVKPDGEADTPQPNPQPSEPGETRPHSSLALDRKGLSPVLSREVSTGARSHDAPSSQPFFSDVQDKKRLSLDKPLPEQPQEPPPAPPLGREPSAASVRQPSSALTSRANSVAASVLLQSTPSTATIKSRRASHRASVMSALPKHMKSTSSRFSFDMIGAAKQEKLLEERHRQREAEKKTTDPRDSTFDEFDEDFDYDAMMDDDGLEERIPGVNADLEEDDYLNDYPEDYPEDIAHTEIIVEEAEEEEDPEAAMDPDNDQENFAGFVFQRSNPASSVTSPHSPGMLATPRDAHGRAIGFAMTKDTTPDLGTATSPVYLTDPHAPSKLEETISGLGIQGLVGVDDKLAYNGAAFQSSREIPPAGGPRPSVINEDDLYFDEGLADELNFEHDGEEFDESIFDNNDTDAYGRPIPGAFAQAQAERAAKREASRRESDMTSRLSAQSAVTQSTAHTSLSVELQKLAAAEEEDSTPSAGPAPALSIAIPGQDLMYQAALAEAAQKAEAAGKFRRTSSPPLPADLTITSPTDSSGSNAHSQPDNSLDQYEDDPYSMDNGLDDYDFDDEAIIAEANADALASDSDGWYGQEFGFYSAPAQPSHHGHGQSNSTKNALSAENMVQFGGFFAAAGQSINRSTSGRIVSREPNLTPITERSEYSNRNSIMSLIVPPFGSDGRNSASLQSPGLAQLAMMADDDNMSLSALLKLRSRAWGGSQASLASSREGSPRSERPGGDGASSPWGIGSAFMSPQGTGIHARKNSAFSLWTNSEAGSTSGSPTLTMGMPLPLSSPPVPVPPLPSNMAGSGQSNPMIPAPLFSPPLPPQQQPSPGTGVGNFSPVLEAEESDSEDSHTGPFDLPDLSSPGALVASPPAVDPRDLATATALPGASAAMSPTQQHARRPGMGHRHKGSADSISYRKEEESGDWVMERRRTADTGEVELLGREVVGSGRI